MFPSLKKNFWNTLLFTALGVILAAQIVPGVESTSMAGLVTAALILGLMNALLKPLLVIGALPFVVMTLGFGLWLINAGLFALTARLVKDLTISSFWSALGGAAVISLTQIFLSVFTGAGSVRVSRGGQDPDASGGDSGGRDGVNRLPRGPGRGDRDDSKDVIDI